MYYGERLPLWLPFPNHMVNNMAFRNLPPLYILREFFALDDELQLVNAKNRGRAKKGARSGHLDAANNRWRVWFQGKSYHRYRIIWALANGRLPGDLSIDHINRDPSDDRPENLRRATRSEQTLNSEHAGRKNMKGIYPIPKANGEIHYKVAICLGGKYLHFGVFPTITRARAAYLDAADKLEITQFLPLTLVDCYSAARDAVTL